MNHEVINFIDLPAGTKYLLRFVGDPIPSRCVYVRQDEGVVRRTVVNAIAKLEEKDIKIYQEAFAICMDAQADGCLAIAHLSEPLVLAIQRFVQAGGPDPGCSESVCFLVEIGTGDPVMMTVQGSKPNDLEPSVYERAAAMKYEMCELASADRATMAEVLDFDKAELLCPPYRSEAEFWFEPREAVEKVMALHNFPWEDCVSFQLDKLKLYEQFLTYVSECCEDDDVSMIAGILCRIKERD